MHTLRIFVSSPGDVGEERSIAQRVIERLKFRYAGRIKLAPLLWEQLPLVATASFQEQIPNAAEFDIVLDETSQARHDGVTSDHRRVQIKATFKDSLTFRMEPDYYLGLQLFPDGRHEVVFNGPGKVITEAFGHRKGFGEALLSFPVSRLRELSATVPDKDRIPRRRERGA